MLSDPRVGSARQEREGGREKKREKVCVSKREWVKERERERKCEMREKEKEKEREERKKKE